MESRRQIFILGRKAAVDLAVCLNSEIVLQTFEPKCLTVLKTLQKQNQISSPLLLRKFLRMKEKLPSPIKILIIVSP